METKLERRKTKLAYQLKLRRRKTRGWPKLELGRRKTDDFEKLGVRKTEDGRKINTVGSSLRVPAPVPKTGSASILTGSGGARGDFWRSVGPAFRPFFVHARSALDLHPS